MARRTKKIANCYCVTIERDEHLLNPSEMARSATTLMLRGSRITDAAMAQLCRFSQLNELHLIDTTSVTDQGLEQIENLAQIEWLNIDALPLSNKSLECIRNLRHLKGLQLIGTHITDSGLWKLRRLKKLEYLDLQQACVTNRGLKHLAKMKSLKTLRLINTHINDAGLVYFAQMRGLQNLYLHRSDVTRDGVSSLRLLLPKTCMIDMAPPLPAWTAQFAW